MARMLNRRTALLTASISLLLALLLTTAYLVVSGRPNDPAQDLTPGSPNASTTLASAAIEVGPGTRTTLTVGGTAEHPLQLEIDPGDLSSEGTVALKQLAQPPPEWAGFRASGDVTEIEITAGIAKPLKLSFSAGDRPQEVPVIWRQDPESGWYPVADGEPGGTAQVERSSFSPFVVGTIDLARWARSTLAWAGRWITDRTTAPLCGESPKWADLTQPGADILLTCVESDAGQAVLKMKNNRGLAQEVRIPSDVSYANVKNQPEGVRKLVRTLAGGRDIVVLPPGDEVRIGFAPPDEERHVSFTPEVSRLSLASELTAQLFDIAHEKGSLALLPALVHSAGCTGLKSYMVAGILPTGMDALNSLLLNLGRCFLKVLKQPKLAVLIVQQYVAAKYNTSVAIVASDSSWRKEVVRLTRRVHLVSRLAAGALAGVLSGKLAYSIYKYNAEKLSREHADRDPAKVELTLKAQAATSPSPSPTVTVPAPSDPSEDLGIITAKTGSGDAATVSLSFSTLRPPSEVGDALSNCPVDTARALVARMDVTARVDSSLAAEVTVNWIPNFIYAPADQAAGVYLLSQYSDGPKCKQLWGSNGNYGVHWMSIQPGAPEQFSTWWIFTRAISPATPHGDTVALGQMLLEPQVLFAGAPAQVQYSGHRFVECSQSQGMGGAAGFYLAGTRPERLLVGGLSENLTCR